MDYKTLERLKNLHSELNLILIEAIESDSPKPFNEELFKNLKREESHVYDSLRYFSPQGPTKPLRSFEVTNDQGTWDIQADDFIKSPIDGRFSFLKEGKLISEFWNVTAWIEII